MMNEFYEPENDDAANLTIVSDEHDAGCYHCIPNPYVKEQEFAQLGFALVQYQLHVIGPICCVGVQGAVIAAAHAICGAAAHITTGTDDITDAIYAYSVELARSIWVADISQEPKDGGPVMVGDLDCAAESLAFFDAAMDGDLVGASNVVHALGKRATDAGDDDVASTLQIFLGYVLASFSLWAWGQLKVEAIVQSEGYGQTGEAA